MSKAHDDFVAAFERFMEKTSIADAMSVAAGMFVSLVAGYAESKGEDPNKEITVKGGAQRDIIICAVKPLHPSAGE